MKKKDIIVLLVIVGVGFGIGQVAMGFGLGKYVTNLFKDSKEVARQDIENATVEELLGPKKDLAEEEKVAFVRLHNEAKAYLQKSQIGHALEPAKKMMTLNPYDPIGYMIYAGCAIDLLKIKLADPQAKVENGNFEVNELRQAAEIAYKLDPKNPTVLENKANYHYTWALMAKGQNAEKISTREFKNAHKYVDELYALSKDKAKYTMSHAQMYMAENDYENALINIQKAQQEDTAQNHRIALVALEASCYEKRQDFKKASAIYREALENGKMTPMERVFLLKNRAKFYIMRDMDLLARRDLLSIQEIMPENEQVKKNIEELEKKINADMKARENGGYTNEGGVSP